MHSYAKYSDACGTTLAIVDSVHNMQPGLAFLGSKKDDIQIGQFRYQKGKILKDHVHIKRERIIEQTQETLIVFTGKVEARIYDLNDVYFITVTLEAGDYLVYYAGGIGYTVLEDDTRMLEIKTGPYEVESDDEDRRLL